tara:strand:+ start:1725 stop:2009 length:285 start_codon:yes stop_codon:yes gene_type:complete
MKFIIKTSLFSRERFIQSPQYKQKVRFSFIAASEQNFTRERRTMLENFEMFKVPLSLGDKNVSKKVFVRRGVLSGLVTDEKVKGRNRAKRKIFL